MNWQIGRAFSENDASSYAAVSELYHWVPSSQDERGRGGEKTGQWELFQRLGPEFKSVVSSSSTANARDIFCGPFCPPLSADQHTIAVPHIRGAPAITFLSDEGEEHPLDAARRAQPLCERHRAGEKRVEVAVHHAVQVCTHTIDTNQYRL